MSSKFQFVGLDSLRNELRKLPEDLTHEGNVIVKANAEEAARRIQQVYPEGPTGNLKRGVSTQVQSSGRFGVAVVVRSRAKHSHLWERGTGPRRNSKGQNRGSMPQGPEAERMVPIVVRRRRVMFEALKALVERAGFQVTER